MKYIFFRVLREEEEETFLFYSSTVIIRFFKCYITIKTSKCCFYIVLNNYQLYKEYLFKSDIAFVEI
jgi:hypothetical protein